MASWRCLGRPLAHEDHAVRACYAALAMQAAVQQYAAEVQRTHGVPVQMRVGLNAGEVVVRAIGNDLHMDYSAIGQTTHLAARMEQMAMPGSILLTPAVLGLAEGYVQVTTAGTGACQRARRAGGGLRAGRVRVASGGACRRRRSGGSRALSAGTRNWRPWARPWSGRGPATGRWSRWSARPGWGSPAWSMSVSIPTTRRAGGCWRVPRCPTARPPRTSRSSTCSSAMSTSRTRDDPRTIRAKVTGQVLTLDETLQDTIPALLWLLDALPDDSPFRTLDPPQRRQRTLDALKRVLLRESQVQPLLLVFEDLHWIDTETQALLDSLVESLPTARLLLLVNYRPEYQHGWGSKTYYTQLRLDPLPPASADELLQALLGDDPSLAPLKPAADRAHRGQSLLPGGERADAGGDGGAGRGAGAPIAWRRPLPDLAGAGDRAGGAGGAHRPAATRGEAPAPDRRRHRHGGALAPAAGHCRAARGERCSAAWRTSRRPSSSTRRASFPSTSTPSSTP